MITGTTPVWAGRNSSFSDVFLLLLVLGIVECTSVPSSEVSPTVYNEPPVHPDHSTPLILITHQVEHVTFQVSEKGPPEEIVLGVGEPIIPDHDDIEVPRPQTTPLNYADVVSGGEPKSAVTSEATVLKEFTTKSSADEIAKATDVSKPVTVLPFGRDVMEEGTEDPNAEVFEQQTPRVLPFADGNIISRNSRIFLEDSSDGDYVERMTKTDEESTSSVPEIQTSEISDNKNEAEVLEVPEEVPAIVEESNTFGDSHRSVSRETSLKEHIKSNLPKDILVDELPYLRVEELHPERPSTRFLPHIPDEGEDVLHVAGQNDSDAIVPNPPFELPEGTNHERSVESRILTTNQKIRLVQHKHISAVVPGSLGAGTITAITFGVLLSLTLLLGGGGFFLYQRRAFNRPKVLNSERSYANSESGGYIDDQCRVSYVNSHTDVTKGASEDLISLDNDSFLNSLESMTIQNLWTDNIKHTKL